MEVLSFFNAFVREKEFFFLHSFPCHDFDPLGFVFLRGGGRGVTISYYKQTELDLPILVFFSYIPCLLFVFSFNNFVFYYHDCIFIFEFLFMDVLRCT